MFLRIDHDLFVTGGPDQPVHRVPWHGQFGYVSGLRWCPAHEELMVTAVAAGGKLPEVRSGQRGELALYRCSPAQGQWHQVYRGYSHDPVCIPGHGYAVHRGGGLTFLSPDGSVVRENKVGRFDWGPPSLSVSPDGQTVARIRWKGDNRKLCFDDVVTGASRQLSTSVYGYGWLGSDTVIYQLGAGPRRLELATGRTGSFGVGLRRLILAMPTATTELRALAALGSEHTWEIYQGLEVLGDTVWLAAGLASRTGAQRATGLFRLDASGEQGELVTAVETNELIESFLPCADGSVVLTVAVYESMAIVARRRVTTGPLASFLAEGWDPAATSVTAEMGFHVIQ